MVPKLCITYPLWGRSHMGSLRKRPVLTWNGAIYCRQTSNINRTLVGNTIFWSLRCSWSSADNYIFILDLTPGFNGLGKDNCKTKLETYKFFYSVQLIFVILRYIPLLGAHIKTVAWLLSSITIWFLFQVCFLGHIDNWNVTKTNCSKDFWNGCGWYECVYVYVFCSFTKLHASYHHWSYGQQEPNMCH